MRWIMFIEIHGDDNPQESCYFRHRFALIMKSGTRGPSLISFRVCLEALIQGIGKIKTLKNRASKSRPTPLQSWRETLTCSRIEPLLAKM
uniref:Uncharacterized protein n=1 Tax=Candidatus Kentrum sp. LPFa TaxID=2126335 RepID=A0A450W6X5_9GAMM|nr:MAG: hypothetical protein BECKLPF1236B_GA0070989_104017 [Candidatus Kentron sp. LPFa]